MSSRPFAALVTLVALALSLPQSPAYAEDEPLPVSYRFLENVVANGTAESAPGANRWDCRPTKAKPRPVVLLHGTGGNAATNWGTYSALLANEGWCVFALTYGDVPETQKPTKLGGMTDMRDSAQQVAEFVTKVRRATGAAKVDLVGHSQGTLMPNYYVRFLGGHRSVERYVSIASAWHGMGGDDFGRLWQSVGVFGPLPAPPVCAACAQMPAGSEFMQQMRAGQIAHPSVTYTNIVTRYDGVVTPYTSGIQTGYSNMANIVLQDVCPTDFSDHTEIASSYNVTRLVMNALDPAQARPFQCRTTLPVLG